MDIILLQETHATTLEIQQSFHQSFPAAQSFWTEHCGIIFTRTDIRLEPLFSTIDRRVLAVTLTHTEQVFEPNHIVNIYAPATTTQKKIDFYRTLLSLPILNVDETVRTIIAGDFNVQLLTSNHTPRNLKGVLQPLTAAFRDCINETPGLALPTFRRGTVLSCIDFILASMDLALYPKLAAVDFVNPDWTNHALLTCSFALGPSPRGPGLRKVNPLLAHNPIYPERLYSKLIEIHASLSQRASPQDNWDRIKEQVLKFSIQFDRKEEAWRTRQLRQLRSTRNKLLRVLKSQGILLDRLPIVERQIAALQAEITNVDALRAGRRWREKGKKDAGYLKRTAQAREAQRLIPALQRPTRPGL